MTLSPLYILTGTYNLHQQPIPNDITRWLGNRLENSTVLPDLVAVAFQEFAPYPDAFITTPESILYQCDKAIRHTLNNWATTDASNHEKEGKRRQFSSDNTRSEEYELGMALLVYARRGAPFVVSATSVNDVGCGIAWAGNKGAVGVYCRLAWHSDVNNHTTFEEQRECEEEKEEENETTMTTTSIEMAFINVHLMAHADQLERRHQELQMIMERLLFDVNEGNSEQQEQQEQQEEQPLVPNDVSHTAITTTVRILDLPIVFLMGDLNYRVTPQGGAIHDNVAWSYDVAERVKSAVLHEASSSFPITNDVETISHLRHTCDQLTVARRQDRRHVLTRFNEPECKFAPTYKFTLNSDQYALTQRTPSWCDRIFYYVYGGETASTIIATLWYDACFDFHQSDHRPVVAMFRMDTSHLNQVSYQAALAAQATHTPSMIDAVRHSRQQQQQRHFRSLHYDSLQESELRIVQPDPWWRWKQRVGRMTTQCFGRTWWLFTSGWWWRIALTGLLATLFSVYYSRN
ncbi:Endonuclease/exonuclease/phosphatase [Syncephalis plumigaleata]|nr:Endonuclease/exonuclease/phosphatase [Syncephalis plumigaleata]